MKHITPPVHNTPLISTKQITQIAQSIDLLFSLLLWLTYIAAIVASFNHVAWAFNLLENPEDRWVGKVAAAAVDGGLAVIAYVIQQRRKANAHREVEDKEAIWMLVVGILFLGLISMIANFLHGVSIELNVNSLTYSQIQALDMMQWVRITTNAITLPVIVIYLGEILEAPGAQGVMSQLLRDLSIMTQTLTQTESTLSLRESELATLESTLNAKEDALNELVSKVGHLEAELKNRDKSLGQVEAQVNQLQGEARQHKEVLGQYEAKVAQHTGMREHLLQLEEALTQKEAHILRLQAAIQSAEQAKQEAKTAEKHFSALFNVLNIETQEIAKYILAQQQGEPITLESARGKAARIANQEMSKSSFQRLYTAVRKSHV